MGWGRGGVEAIWVSRHLRFTICSSATINVLKEWARRGVEGWLKGPSSRCGKANTLNKGGGRDLEAMWKLYLPGLGMLLQTHWPRCAGLWGCNREAGLRRICYGSRRGKCHHSQLGRRKKRMEPCEAGCRPNNNNNNNDEKQWHRAKKTEMWALDIRSVVRKSLAPPPTPTHTTVGFGSPQWYVKGIWRERLREAERHCNANPLSSHCSWVSDPLHSARLFQNVTVTFMCHTRGFDVNARLVLMGHQIS